MARPIAATPTLKGKGTEKFLEEMEKPSTIEHEAFLEEARKIYREIKVNK
jgi:hypothetical protein